MHNETRIQRVKVNATRPKMVDTFQNPLRQEHGERDKPSKMASGISSNYDESIGRNVFILYPTSYIPGQRLIEAVSGEKFAEYEPMVSPNHWSSIVCAYYPLPDSNTSRVKIGAPSAIMR